MKRSTNSISSNRLHRGLWTGVALSGALASLAAAQPNIEVRINNVVQTDGQEFTYEATDVGESRPLIVVVRNIGSANLQFPSAAPVFFVGGFDAQFGIIQPPLEGGNLLSPNGSTAFRVDFAPNLPKAEMSTVVTIPTNDPDSPLFNLNLRGVVPVPELTVSVDGQTVAPTTQVNFPRTAVGETSEKYVTIANSGDRPLEITEDIDVSGGFGSNQFSIVQSPIGALQPGESVDVVVAFTPTRTGSASATVGISSNDIGNLPAGRFTFNVRGVATAALIDDGNAGDNTNENGGNADEPIDGNQNGNSAADETGAGDGADADDDDGAADDTVDEQDDGGAADDSNSQQQSLVTPCGFGGPFGLALGLASLASLRSGRRRM